VYHKYDTIGNLQFYTAHLQNKIWEYKQITDWDYRWEFSGNGSINTEVNVGDFKKRDDGYYEVDYWHIQYGNGTILLNNKFENVGKVLKHNSFKSSLEVEGDFPGLMIQTAGDIGNSEDGFRYLLKWETINRNRDKPRELPWPGPSQLYLYKLKK
jgi:hypothetical protein